MEKIQLKDTVPSEFTELTYAQEVMKLQDQVNGIVTGSAQIPDGSVTSVKLADGSVVTSKIAPNAITSLNLATGSVGTPELLGASVTNDKIVSMELDKATTSIANGKVLSMSAGKIVGVDLKGVPSPTDIGLVLKSTNPGSFAWGPNTAIAIINDGTITNAKLASGSVDSVKVQDGAITSSKLSQASVTQNKLASGSVTNACIADGSIDPIKLSELPPSEIGDLSVTTEKLAEGAVTTSKIANGAVNGAQIAENAVNSVNLATASVLPQNIDGTTGQSGQVLTTDGTNVTWQAGGGGGLPPEDSIVSTMIQDNAVIGTKIANGSVSTDKIVDSAITNSKIASDLSGEKIVTETISINKLKSETASKVGQVATISEDLKVAWQDPKAILPERNTITEDMLKDDCVTTYKIADKSIRFAHFRQPNHSFTTLPAECTIIANPSFLDIDITTASITPSEITGAINYQFASASGTMHMQFGDVVMAGTYCFKGTGTSSADTWRNLPTHYLGNDGTLFPVYYVTTGATSSVATTCGVQLHPKMFDGGVFPAKIRVKLFTMVRL